jgi:PAS domain S-box-containing protein
LVTIGLIACVISNGLIAWTLSTLHTDRVRLLEQEGNLAQETAKLRRLGQEARTEISELLQEGLPNIPERYAVDEFVAEFPQLIKALQNSVLNQVIVTDLSNLETAVKDLKKQQKKIIAWRTQYEEVWKDVSKEHTLNQVRAILHRLRASVETLEGRQRLQEAIQVRRWRKATEEKAPHLAQVILSHQTQRWSRVLKEADAELADLERLVEMLSSEMVTDNLINLKDNQLKPSLERLEHNFAILADEFLDTAGLSAQTIEELKNALFGKGYVIDAAHQTIRIGKGGLYNLRRDALRLLNEREKLLAELQECYHQRIEMIYPKMESLARERSRTLAKQAEERLAEVWHNMLLLSVLILAGFLALGWVISKSLRQQVNAIAHLRRQNELILNSAGEGIIGLDQKGKVTFVNPAGARMIGWNPEDMIGRPHYETLRHSKLDELPCSLGECSLNTALKKGTLYKQDKEVFWRKDGTIFPVEYVSNPIKDETGQFQGAVVMFLDITDRKRAEEKLKKALADAEEARDKIDAILKSVADGLIATDVENRIILMNRFAEDLLGVRLNEVFNKPIDAVIKEKSLKEGLAATLAGETSQISLDLEMPSQDKGEVRVIQARTSVAQSKEGAKTGVMITILRDVTKERELDRMKSEFISTAAHELRTPLTSVIGFTELLLDSEFDPLQQREFLSCIYEKAEVLSNIVDDLLDISRIESGRTIYFVKAPCDMNEAIRQLTAQYQKESNKHCFDVVLPEKPTEIIANRGKIGQVLENLLSNAVKYSPKGGLIRITGAANGGNYQTSVEDEGIGMTAEQTKRIFEKFYRADASNTAIGGLGLGMSIVKNIVEAHGGNIWVESQLDKGTKVTFSIPMKAN